VGGYYGILHQFIGLCCPSVNFLYYSCGNQCTYSSSGQIIWKLLLNVDENGGPKWLNWPACITLRNWRTMMSTFRIYKEWKTLSSWDPKISYWVKQDQNLSNLSHKLCITYLSDTMDLPHKLCAMAVWHHGPHVKSCALHIYLTSWTSLISCVQYVYQYDTMDLFHKLCIIYLFDIIMIMDLSHKLCAIFIWHHGHVS
jgi:hypothetical protein